MAQVLQGDVPHPGESYWQEFGADVQAKLLQTATARKRVSWYWYVAAAATFAVMSWQIVDFFVPENTEPVSFEAVLPAVEEDTEFLFLLSIVELSDSVEELEESLGWSSASNLDLSQLTTEEAERFRRELEEEMGDEHAKS